MGTCSLQLPAAAQYVAPPTEEYGSEIRSGDGETSDMPAEYRGMIPLYFVCVLKFLRTGGLPPPAAMVMAGPPFIHSPPVLMPMMVPQSEGVASSNSTTSPRTTSPPPSAEDLRKMLRTQVEYYFSKENLSTDKYLCMYLVW